MSTGRGILEDMRDMLRELVEGQRRILRDLAETRRELSEIRAYLMPRRAKDKP